MKSSRIVVQLGAWLAVAIAVGASGVLTHLVPPAPQVMLLAITAALLAATRVVPWLRAWCDAADARWLVALHVSRFVGFLFLAYGARGILPMSFARPAGIGDVAVATLACLLLSFAPDRGPVARRLLMLWNVAGFADIVGVVLTAARTALQDPESMSAMLRLPLSLLLTFLVPLVIATHVLIFMRLRRMPGETFTMRG